MPGPLSFHDVGDADFSDYVRLFRAYAALYGRDLPDEHLDFGWRALMSGENRCAMAVWVDRAVGFVQYRVYRWLLHGTTSVYADDLYVDPAARGNRVGTLLLEELARRCAVNGWEGVRWITTDENLDGQRLYDRFAARAPVVTYDLSPIVD